MTHKDVILHNGATLRIELLNGKEYAREFQRFINALTREGAYLPVDKPVTFKEEKTWLRNQIQAHKK